MTTMPGAAIRADAVSRSFGSGRVRHLVIDQLSLCVSPGELTLICGPSGCGKSTLLALLSGLLSPDAGRISVHGEELGAKSEAERERFRLQNVGFVFQHFHLFPALCAWEQVALLLQYTGVDPEPARRRAMAALDALDLSHRVNAVPAELSGGEQQRVAIARAMAKNPAIMFVDEPTSALDATSGRVVIDSLHRMAQSAGTTVLCVSHDLRLVDHADRVLTIEDGRILSDTQNHRLPQAADPVA